MAASTVTSTMYGYRVSGGTDITTISTNQMNVKSLLFIPATGANTCTLVDKDGSAFMVIKGDATAGIATQIWVEERVNGLKATHAGANDVLLVFVD